jgi:hypothetical protein
LHLKYLLGIIQSDEKKKIECNASSFEVLSAIGKLSFRKLCTCITSLSPVAENQVRVNHLIRFQQPMSDPTNEPSH